MAFTFIFREKLLDSCEDNSSGSYANFFPQVCAVLGLDRRLAQDVSTAAKVPKS